jgi:hypothetical protein
MAYIGKQRGRRKVLVNVRITYDGAGNCTIYKDGVSAGTFVISMGVWVEIFSVVQFVDTVNYLEIFDSTGETMQLGLGAAGSEVNLFQILPGGNGDKTVRIESGQRLAITAVSANPTANCETCINFFD